MKLFPFYNSRELTYFIYAILILFLLSFLGLGKLGTNVLIPLTFFSILNKPLKIKFIFKLSLVKWYSLIIVISSFSIFYAISPDAAISAQLKKAIVFLFSLTILSFAIESFRNIKLLYLANIFVFLFLIMYVLSTGLELNTSGRADVSILNANSYGYYIFNGLTSIFFLYSSLKFKSKFRVLFFILIIIFCILSSWLVLLSASRGASIITSILIIGNFYLLFIVSRKSRTIKFFTILFFLIGLIFTVNYVENNHYKDSHLNKRFGELESRESPRQFHLRKAIEIGFDNPIIGVGSGNYAIIPKEIEQGSFTHNSFAEIFANFGFLGLIIFFFFLIQIPKKVIKLLKFANDKHKLILYQILFYCFVFVMYSFFYVSFMSTVFMHFFFLVYAHLIFIEKEISLRKLKYVKSQNKALYF